MPSELADAFMDLVYNRIKHGDEKHQEWLRQECTRLADSLDTHLETFRANNANLKRELDDLKISSNRRITSLETDLSTAKLDLKYVRDTILKY
jgi:t-SNARE complex subunit (syntaxin)